MSCECHFTASSSARCSELHTREVLSVAEDRAVSDCPTVTIQSGDGGPSRLATLEGTLICVHTRDREGLSRQAEHPFRYERSDEETAAYVLRPWLERL